MQLPRFLSVFLKGIAMGAADVVPGVSGGTIAFITGIYEELLDSIKRLNIQAFKTLFQKGPKAFWQSVNGNFFLCLLGGVAVSFLLFSRLILHVMAAYPLQVWSFFFGLVLASTWHLFKAIDSRKPIVFIGVVAGAIFAYVASSQMSLHLDPTPMNFFIGGAIAICAMILPGISGSFILLLLGLYLPVLTAIKSLDLPVIFLFFAGAITGLLLFVRVLSWLLHQYKTATLSTLSGFLLGSLTVLWPWKRVLEYRESSSGLKPLVQENISPMQYTELTQLDPMMGQCAVMLIIGFALILCVEQFTKKR